MDGMGARGRMARYSSSNKRKSSGFTQSERSTCRGRLLLAALLRASAVFASFILVFSEVFFLTFLKVFYLIAYTLGGLDRSFTGEIVARVGRWLMENSFPFIAFRDQIFQRLTNIGVLPVVSIQIVLQLISETGELFNFGAQLRGSIVCALFCRKLPDGGDALLDEFREELDAIVGAIPKFPDLIHLLFIERILLSLGPRARRKGGKA